VADGGAVVPAGGLIVSVRTLSSASTPPLPHRVARSVIASVILSVATRII
jgi:hypothetical protein